MPRNHSDRDWVIIQGSDFTGNVHPDSELTESIGNHRKLYELGFDTYQLTRIFVCGCFWLYGQFRVAKLDNIVSDMLSLISGFRITRRIIYNVSYYSSNFGYPSETSQTID